MFVLRRGLHASNRTTTPPEPPAAPAMPPAASAPASGLATSAPLARPSAEAQASARAKVASQSQAQQQQVQAKAATALGEAAATSTTAQQIIAGFKQGGTGNCVSVAAIKAAMVAFGPGHIFRDVVAVDGGRKVTMRDGAQVTVSDAELREAARHARFQALPGGDPALVEHATLAYAAMAKRAMAEGNDGRRHRTFASACHSLNNGESYLEGAHWLGLDGHMKEIPASEIPQHAAVVAASKKHAVFSHHGTIDRFGSGQQTDSDGFGRSLRWAYAIIPDTTTPTTPTPTPTPTTPTPVEPPATTTPTPPPPVTTTPGSGGTGPASGGTQVSGQTILAAFKQGGTGNCVSVAAIKAAMTTFGPEGVFRSQTRVPGGVDVVMRDGVTVHVTDEELRKAPGLSRFVGAEGPLLDQANLMFAAMSKRALLEGNDNRRFSSIEAAARSLNDGESYLEGAAWLGLSRHMKTVGPDELSAYPAAVAASKKHAVFVSDGQIDRFGEAAPASRGDGFGRSLRWAYAIVPDEQPAT